MIILNVIKPVPDSIRAVKDSTVVALCVVPWSVSGSRSDTTKAVVGCSVAVSKFCARVLVAIVDSLSAIFNVLLTMVV